MRLITYKLILIVFLVFQTILQAQQMPIYSQYFMNRMLINPARTGAYGLTTVELTAREQWAGIRGAPSTKTIAFQTRMLKSSHQRGMRSARKRYGRRGSGSNVGLGGYLFTDKVGILNYTGIHLNYAYHLRLRSSQLSFGITGQFYQFAIDEENIVVENPDDALLNSSNLTSYVPDAGVGVYYVFTNFYAGVSATQLFESAIRFGSTDYKESKMLRQYYAMVGYNVELDKAWDIEPSVLYRMNELPKGQLDLNARLFYRSQYWAGLSYRTGNIQAPDGRDNGTIIMMAGVSVDMFHFGYAFDYGLNNIQKYTYGSHEINVAVRFGNNARRYRYIDRF